MKKFVMILLVSVFVFGLGLTTIPVNAELDTTFLIKEEENDFIYTDSVRLRFEEINSKYEIGERFSVEDANFIRENSIYNLEHNAFVPVIDEKKSTIQPLDLTIWADGYWGERGSSGSGCNTSYTVGADYRIKTSFIGTGAATYSSGVRLLFSSGASNVKSVVLGTKLTTYGLLGSSGTYIGITSSTQKTQTFTGGYSNYYAKLQNTNYVLLSAWAYGNSWVEINTSNCHTSKYVF